MNNYKELKQDIIKVVAIVSIIVGFIYFFVIEAKYYEIYDALYAFKPILGEAYALLVQAIQLYGGIILAPFVVWFYINKREKLVNKYNELYKTDIKKFNNTIIKVWCVVNIKCGLLLEIIAFILLIYEIIDNRVIFILMLFYVLAMIITPLVLVKILKLHKEVNQQENEEDNKNKKIKDRNYKIYKTVVIILNIIHCVLILWLASLFASWNSEVYRDY